MTRAPSVTLPRRVEYIDGLRGVAVVAMFVVHAAVAWLAPEAQQGSYFEWAMAVSGLVAPTFLFLAGLSMVVVADRERSAGADPSSTRWRLARRGLEIVATGYALHLLYFALDGFGGTWTRVLKVDVLHCVGLAMLAFAPLAAPSTSNRFVAGAAFVLLPVLGSALYRLPIGAYLPRGIAAYLTTREPLALFPFVPYATWVALGLCIGPWWLSASRDARRETRFAIAMLVAAAIFYATGKALGTVYYDLALDTLGLPAGGPAQTKGLLHLFFHKGAFVLVFVALAIFGRSLWRSPAARPLVLFGKRSLFAYGAHLVLIYPVAGRYLAERLDPAAHAALSAALTLVMYGLVVLRGRLDGLAARRGPAPLDEERRRDPASASARTRSA